ncbi:MAG: gliding motility-associated C-terminal domain-containing protein [Bacteroidales bacterium]|nr:gliding motility-associated C-terminal domain-containing protein [Bacteroidales bacterium]
MKFLFALILCLTSSWQLLAQNCITEKPIRYADNWLFPNLAALKFSDNGVTSNSSNSKLTFGKGSSSISDADGKLLLFTDGKRVYSGNFDELANDLNGNPNSTQSSIIVLRPGSSSRFFVFTVDQYLIIPGQPPIGNGFRYSEIDVIGQGLVIRRNIPLKPQVSEKLTSVLHKNGTDYWVVAHNLVTDDFYTYLVDKDGVSNTPVVSQSGSPHSGEDFETKNALGYMKTSPDGALLALAITGQKKIEVFSFNDSTGVVSSPQTIDSPDPNMPYGIEFSPDSRHLYITTVNFDSPSTNSKLYQYEMQNLAVNPVLLNDTLLKDVTALQLGRDGKIYVARFNQGWLGAIQNPKRPGLECNYKENGMQLGNNNKATMGLPNFVTSFLQTPHFWADPKCMQSPTAFELLNKSNIDSVEWVFDAPSSNPVSSKVLYYSHAYASSGNFIVEITEEFNGQRFGPYKQNITINASPVNLIPGVPDVLWLYSDTYHTLNGGTNATGNGSLIYKWYYLLDLNDPGIVISNQRTHTIYATSNSEGYYKLMVEDINCCKNERIIQIKTGGLKIPNAFNPASLISVNQRFRPFGGPVADYSIQIFNKFGQMVYTEATPPDTEQGGYKGEGWNGKMFNSGTDCPAGIYVYQFTYKVFDKENYIPKPPQAGIVMLVR